LRQADATGARYAVILGEDEVVRGVAAVKPLRAGGEQVERPLADVPSLLLAEHGTL
jgi:histidyl-tRNA synthetase